MNQADLNRAVAAVTGETVETIARQGFGFVDVPQVDRDPLVFDWDSRDARLFGELFE
jgi:hypothetical protein